MAVLLQLLTLLRGQQREDLVLGADPQYGQLTASFSGAVGHSAGAKLPAEGKQS
jgi:hypothetical protein